MDRAANRSARAVLAALVLTATLLVTAAVAGLSARLHTSSPLARTDAAVVADALPRLAFLQEALAAGAGERMQRLFPEGYYFSYVLYGLTWVDVGMRDESRRSQALTEARWALAHLDSDAGRAPFSAQLSPPYGVFYVGWTSWLRGGVVRLAGGAEAAPDEAAQLFADTAALADAFQASLAETGSPFLPAYPDQAWPVDSVVGLAAVRLAAELSGDAAAREPLLSQWWRAADARRDPATGLLAHRVDPHSGQPIEGARGTSQSMLLRFLRELDPVAAAEDWQSFRQQFGSTLPGLPGFREYPRGVRGAGDVDSGPLILGMSAATSVVALGSAVLFEDRATAQALTGFAEVTGVAVEFGGKRRYLGGRLPVGDAFLAWSMAADSWLVPPGAPAAAGSGPSGWWLLWQLPLLGLLGTGGVLSVAAVGRLAQAGRAGAVRWSMLR